jgi:hypothetical protein
VALFAAEKRTELNPGSAYAPAMGALASEGERLTPQAAAAEITRIENLHGALARRTAGMVWMVWGIVAPAIFMTYSFIFHAFPGQNFAGFWWILPLLWIPWAAMGILATTTLWRSAALVLPRDRTRTGRTYLVTGAVIVGLIVIGMAVIHALVAPIAELAWALTAIGIGVTLLAILGININDATERRMWIVGGVLLAATALVGSLVFVGSLSAARDAFAVISPLASGLVMFGGGLYLTSKA